MILITGGAGFIGSRLALAFLKQGRAVRLLDNFSPQIHSTHELPPELRGHVELVRADVRDRDAVKRALTGIDSVVHLAAETGTGQSMYEIERYFSVNVQGTATLLDLLQNDPCAADVGTVVVASSRAVYGEGAYCCASHGTVYPDQRERAAMAAGQFEPVCPRCAAPLSLVPTPEDAPFKPMSVYGLTKQVQEQAVLMWARTRGANAFGLRYQNVYGPGQSLRNPYTGILAVFSNLARQDEPIEVYEDGEESRDFVYIDDVVEATVRCLNFSNRFVGALNVGSGQATSIILVAQAIRDHFASRSAIGITGAFRVGDIRHNTADTARLREVLHFVPAVSFKAGIASFLNWAMEQPVEDKLAYRRSVDELAAKGLMGNQVNP